MGCSGDSTSRVENVMAVSGKSSGFVKRRAGLFTLAAIGCTICSGPAFAQVQTFSDRQAFLAASQAEAQPAWPNLGHMSGGAGASFHLGLVSLSVSAPSSGLWIGSGNHSLVGPDWTTLVAGNDVAIDGQENLNIAFDRPMRAFGFDFAEPTTATVLYQPCSQGCPCSNSTFRVTLWRDGSIAATFDFNRPDDTAAFVGMVSEVAFNRAEVREMGGSCDDEYFGQMYTRVSCAADFNGDTTVDFFDYLDFVDAFSSNLPAADFNGDSTIDFFDYLDFVDAFSLGC